MSETHPAIEDVIKAIEDDQDQRLERHTPPQCPRCGQRHLLGWGPLHCEADEEAR